VIVLGVGRGSQCGGVGGLIIFEGIGRRSADRRVILLRLIEIEQK
jgi:hypothetical protein